MRHVHAVVVKNTNIVTAKDSYIALAPTLYLTPFQILKSELFVG